MQSQTKVAKNKAFKVIIVGPQAVGKSSILYRLSQKKFDTAYISTIGIDFKTYMIRIRQKVYSLQIWDTAGQQKFKALTNTYYKGSQGCICVYDLTDPSSLSKCEYYINKAIQQNITRQCIYLIGNKCDLQHEQSKQGIQMARKYQISYQQCSAKENTSITDIFDKLGEQLVSSLGQLANQDIQEDVLPRVNIREGKKSCCGG